MLFQGSYDGSLEVRRVRPAGTPGYITVRRQRDHGRPSGRARRRLAGTPPDRMPPFPRARTSRAC